MIPWVKHLDQQNKNTQSTVNVRSRLQLWIQDHSSDGMNTFLSNPSGTKGVSNPCSSKSSKLHIWKIPKTNLVALAGCVATHGFQRWPSKLDKRTVNTGLWSKIVSKTQLKQHQKTGLVALLSVDGHPWLDRFGWFWMILHVSESWQSLWLLLLILNPMLVQVLIAHDPSQPPHQHPAVTLVSNNHLHSSLHAQLFSTLLPSFIFFEVGGYRSWMILMNTSPSLWPRP